MRAGLAAFVGLLVSAACGLPDPVPPREEPLAHWRAFGMSRDARRAWVGEEHDTVVLPQARSVSRYASDRRTESYETVTLSSADTALEAFAPHSPREGPAPVVVLRAAASLPWRDVATRLRHLLDRTPPIARVDVALDARRGLQINYLGLRAPDFVAGSQDGARIRLERVGTGERAFVRVRVPNVAWEFPRGAEAVLDDEVGPFAESEFWVEACNRIWGRVWTQVRDEAEGTTIAHVEIADDSADVPFAFVVKVLDILVGVGVRDVSFPEQELHVRLEEPVPEPAAEERPLFPPWAIAAAALGVLLAFTVTLGPLVWRRRRN